MTFAKICKKLRQTQFHARDPHRRRVSCQCRAKEKLTFANRTGLMGNDTTLHYV